jgi:hypothetical protein
MEPIVQPRHAATVSNQRAIVSALVDFETGDYGPTVEATACATPQVTGVTSGRFSVTHSR